MLPFRALVSPCVGNLEFAHELLDLLLEVVLPLQRLLLRHLQGLLVLTDNLGK